MVQIWITGDGGGICLSTVNHLLELGVGDLKHADPYVEEFDVQLKKVFSIWYATF